MDGLPILPGNSFRDVTKTNFHVSQTLGWKNGFRTPKAYPTVGIGGDPLKVNQLNESELDELANWQPTLTYGQSRQAPPAAFIPGHVAFDKKVLRFFGYYKETVQESPQEHYRVHHVKLYYYLEDDSIQITESPRNNSGIPQGTILRRQRIPKNEVGDHYTWKDLNNGMSMCVYGKVYRWTSCDKFTRDFLESEGIVVNIEDEIPEDPYLAERAHREALKTYKTPSSFDARKQFLEMDKKVLRFYAVWDDRDEMFGECRNFIVHYYLANDTMEIKEVHDTNDGRDPFPVLIRRDRIPKNREDVSPTFPNVVLELSPNEIKEYFSPKDLKIGNTINVLGRRFLLYDCDNFTKAWYYQHFGVTDFTPIKIDHRIPEIPKLEMPPYNGFGTLEDSLENSLTFMPQPPKKDFIKQVDNENKVLRYECKMESIRPEDKDRRFILSYRLADDMISIYEVPKRNSGFLGGSFLKRTRVAKPGCTADNPEYYGPLDFCVGAIIEVFGTRFIITTADAYVLSFMQANQDYFPREMINNLTTHLIAEEQMKPHREMIKGGRVTVCRKNGDIFQMMKELKTQLKRMAITDKARIDEMFLRYNKDRTGSITLENMQDICRKMNLPDDEDVLSCLLEEHGTNGKMNLEEFRRFFEC